MISYSRTERKVKKIIEHREREECRFTTDCLIVACPLKSTFQARHGREMRGIEDCPETCCYHPKNSPGRSYRGGRK